MTRLAVLFAGIIAGILAPAPVMAEWVLAQRVFDGDTFLTATGTRVRVMDIDTPETHHPDKRREPGGAPQSQPLPLYFGRVRVGQGAP
ncbi:MAG TPA: hypothetical protein VF859_12670 [Burkholderiales bacterium]